MPTLVILGVILTIVLVFITGITLTNSINISNIVKLREKVASDSAAANSVNAAQTRAALVEQQYSTLQQHHLSRSDLNYITANHPKNLQRFQQQTLATPEQQQQQTPTVVKHLPSPSAVAGTSVNTHMNNNNNKIIIEIGIRNFTAAAAAAAAAIAAQQQLLMQHTVNSNNRSLSSKQNESSFHADNQNQNQTLNTAAAVSAAAAAAATTVQKGEKQNESSTATTTLVEQLVAPFDGAIIDGNIESISVPATSEIRQQLNETLKYFAENDKTLTTTSFESKNSLMLNRLSTLNGNATTSPNNNSNNSSSNNNTLLVPFKSLPLSSSSSVSSLSSSTNLPAITTRTTTTMTIAKAISTSASPSATPSSSSSSVEVVATNKSLLTNSLNSLTSSTTDASPSAQLSPLVAVAQVVGVSSQATHSISTAALINPALTTSTAASLNQLSIEDHNPGLIDFEKRNHVKKVNE